MALLTKQTAVFSLPWLMLAAFVCFCQIVGKWKSRGVALAVAASAGVFASFALLDRLFSVPAGFRGSSLLYVWLGGGSEHDTVIAGNGFNMWTLLGRDTGSSSFVPFEIASIDHVSLSVAPNLCGKVLFIMATCVLVLLFVRSLGGWNWIRSLFRPFSWCDLQRFFLLLVLAMGIQNLAIAVFLCGTHERYLYHGYFFLLLASLGLRRRPRARGGRIWAAALAGAVCYGCFVYSFIGTPPALLFPARRYEFEATIHLVLFFVFMDALWSLGKPRSLLDAEDCT
jgi:hypothetical protein